MLLTTISTTMYLLSLCKLSVETYLALHKEAFDKIYDPNDDKAYTLTNNIESLRAELEKIKNKLTDEDSKDDNDSFKDDDTLAEEPPICNAAEEIFNEIDSILRKRLGKV